MRNELAVLLYGRHIADIRQTSGGQHALAYTSDPGNTPLSLSMPLNRVEHTHRAVEPFLEGLLPDRDDVREVMGREFGVSGRNPLSLLRHIGLDCAGAVQFCDPEDTPAVLNREGELHPVSETEIGVRLATITEGAVRSWVAPAERWSLAGAQPKFALHRTSNGWAEARGATPTTHIIKPGIPTLFDKALNEHICMTAAAKLDLSVARSEYTEFDGHPAIVVERYDRQVNTQGKVVRIHQEDFCQALAVPPSRKYEVDGGPGSTKILAVLRGNARPVDRFRFFAYQAYNYLIGGSDAHAKNLSLLLVGNTVRLAPMYDVSSGYPYVGVARELPIAVAGERRFGRIKDANWARLATQAELEPDEVIGFVHQLAGNVPDALRDAIRVAEQNGVNVSGLADRMLPDIERVCDAIRWSELNPPSGTSTTMSSSTIAKKITSGTRAAKDHT